MAAYAAAKACAAGFTMAYGREVGPYDSTANNVTIATMHRADAGLVAYLASPLGALVSGQTYPMNGGYSIAL
jgi:3-oxoacyl-[acyl-carrier protein] reductase